MNYSSQKIPCSVGILTFNSSENLPKCLESVKDFAEVIICDGGSTDETLTIAKNFGAQIIEQDQTYKYSNNKISDFSGIRNQTLKAATKDWFLIVDSDEYLSEESACEIRGIIANDSEETPKLFHMLRKFEADGKVIDCAGTYPSYQPRFFHKSHVIEFRRKLHEKIVAKEGVLVGYLKKATIVPFSTNLSDLEEKFDYYLNIVKERVSKSTKKDLLKSIYFEIRAICARWVKVTRNAFFCKGNKMPIKFEILSTVHSLKIILIILKTIVKKR